MIEREYIVTQPNTGKHLVGDILKLTDEQATALVNKVELRAEHVNNTEVQKLKDKNDELELTILDLKEQLADALSKIPKRRGRKPKEEPEAIADGV